MVQPEIFTPQVLWAQREDVVYLTVQLADVKDENIVLTADRFEFSASAGSEGKQYHVEFDFFQSVNPAESKKLKTGQNYSFVIVKQESGPYWPRLLKAEGKSPFWLKTDFGKWRDEDEEEETVPEQAMNPFGGNQMDFSNFDMSQFGGGLDAAMPSMEEIDSDDEDVPKEEESA